MLALTLTLTPDPNRGRTPSRAAEGRAHRATSESCGWCCRPRPLHNAWPRRRRAWHRRRRAGRGARHSCRLSPHSCSPHSPPRCIRSCRPWPTPTRNAGRHGMCTACTACGMWHVHVHVHVHGMCTACARHVHGMCTACTHARAPKIEAPRASPLPGISVCSRQASRAIRCNPMHQRLQPYASGGHHAPSAGPRPPVCGVGGAWPGGVW